jgi:Spy/CpxP family protein refolding chaperone
MKRMLIGFLSSFLFLVAAANGSYAGPCACGSHMAQGGMDEGMDRGPRMAGPGIGFMQDSPEAMHFLWQRLMSLDLTEKQKEAIKEVKSRALKETIKKRADLEIAGVELRELLHKDAVDMGAVEAKLKKTESLRTDLRFSHIKAREEIKALLTPEQRKKLKEEREAAFMMGGKRHDGKGRSCDRKDAVQKQVKKEDGPDK